MEAKQQQHQQQLEYSEPRAFTLYRGDVGVRIAPGQAHRVQVKTGGNWVSAVGKVPMNGQRVRVTGSSTSQLIGMKSWTSEVSGRGVGGEGAMQQALDVNTEQERQLQARIAQERALEEQEQAQAPDDMQVRTQVIRLYTPCSYTQFQLFVNIRNG
jgi:hypothetical protein